MSAPTIDLAGAFRLAELLAKTEPMPSPAEVYQPATGADWAFQICTLDAMARMVGPLAQEVQTWRSMTACEEHGAPIYYDGDHCPACRERDLLARLDDSAWTPEPARPARAVALPHQWSPRGSTGEACIYCGVWRNGAAADLCASRLSVRP